jgi:hypothetical protein
VPRQIGAVISMSILFLAPLLYSADEPLCPQVASYTMDVALDTERNAIAGDEVLTWTNTTDNPTDELWFHLYWNAFQNNMSTFLIEGSRRGRGTTHFNMEDWGYCRVDSIKLVDEERSEEFDLLPSLTYRQPDDENSYDRTVFSVKLPYAVAPGKAIVLHIEFLSKIPRPISRTGVYEGSYFIAQWFPKIGVFEDGEWNCHQFHSSSEFFADYGTYDIHITLPSSFVVGATGEHRERTDNQNGTATHHFYQQSVHDFAWTASPYFLEYKEDFAFVPGKSTEITLLLQPYHKHLKDRYMNAVKNAIRYCSLFYGDYPYTTATCVDPAYNSRSGGMEYPTFFAGGAYFIVRKRSMSPEAVTIHEFGHGYFYGLVGSNEFENPWMDEGFTSFLDTEVYYAAYENPLYTRSYFGIPLTFKEVEIPMESDGISALRQTWNMDDMQRFSWQFMEGESYGANSYSKAELMLRTLQRYMGKEVFAHMIKAYSERWWFKHPKPHDFYTVVSEFAGQDMSWFLDQFVYGSAKCDYAVGGISSQPPRKPVGWIDGEYTEGKSPPEKTLIFESEVLVRRLGAVRIPVDVLVAFEDGTEVREEWDGQYRWKKFRYTGPSRIARAVVDPDFKLVVDVDRTNNSLVRKSGKAGALKWTSQWLVWLQHALEFFTIFGS